jgi:hypothetical protein
LFSLLTIETPLPCFVTEICTDLKSEEELNLDKEKYTLHIAPSFATKAGI